MYIFKNRYIYIYTVFVNMCANMFLNIHVNILYVSFTYVYVYKVNWLWGGWVKPTKYKVVLQSKLIVGWLGQTHKFKVVYFWYIGGFDDEGGDDDDDCHGDGDDDGDDVYDDDGDKYGDDDEDEDHDEFWWRGHGRFVGFPHWRYHNHKWNRCESKSSAANFTRRHHQQTNIHWKVWGVRPKWGEKNPFKNMRKHGKLGKIMEDNEKIWQHDKGHKNMTIWEFDSLRELWLKLLSQCAWMVSSTSLQCQGLRFVQSLWADPSHVILKGESGQQWSPVSCRSKHLQMNGLQMAGSHRGQGRAGSRPSNIFKYLQMN